MNKIVIVLYLAVAAVVNLISHALGTLLKHLSFHDWKKIVLSAGKTKLKYFK